MFAFFSFFCLHKVFFVIMEAGSYFCNFDFLSRGPGTRTMTQLWGGLLFRFLKLISDSCYPHLFLLVQDTSRSNS